MSCLPTLVILVLTLTAQVAGDCSVYDTLQSSSTDRCRQVQDCIDEAFFSNGNNVYFLDKVFRSTQSRTPVALIVNYHVTVPENNYHEVNGIDLGTSASGSGSANESNWMITEAEEDTQPLETITYIEQIGWSATGIYKAIRPEVLVALQPAWYWRTLGRAIDNYSFPRSIHLVLNLNATSSNKCSLSGHITRSNITEALKHLTMNLNYNTTGKTTYIWNINTSSLQQEENVLFITIVIVGIFLFVLLTALLPKLHHIYYNKKFNWDRGGLELLFAIMFLIEIYYHWFLRVHLKTDLYSNICGKLEVIVIVVASFGGLYGFAAGCYYNKCSCKGTVRTTNNFCSLYMFVICFAVYSLPVLIEAFIYPTEVISTIGFIFIGVAAISAGHTTLKQYDRSYSNSKTTSSMKKCCHHLQMGLLCICLYFIVPTAVYVLLVFYLSLLKLLLESPTSQLFQLILTLVPVTVGICSLAVEKMLGSQNRADHQKESAELDSDDSDDDTNNDRKRRKRYRELINEEVDEPQDSINTGTCKQSQPERRKPRKRVQADNRRHERQQAPQESRSQEIQMQIEVESNQDNTTENASTM